MEVRTIEELEREAAALATRLSPQEEGATLITLSGDLGAGKTAFAKALAKVLGVADAVTSPTFVLEKIYALPEGAAFSRLVHIDAYRLGGPEELRALGFDELMRDMKNLVVLEWPERVAAALPLVAASLSITSREDGTRSLSYAWQGPFDEASRAPRCARHHPSGVPRAAGLHGA